MRLRMRVARAERVLHQDVRARQRVPVQVGRRPARSWRRPRLGDPVRVVVVVVAYVCMHACRSNPKPCGTGTRRGAVGGEPGEGL